MVFSIRYEIPTHRLFPPRHPMVAEAEKEITRFVSDPRKRLALSYHEAAHAIQFRRFGIETKYSGPAVTHECSTDSYGASYGSVCVRDSDYLKLAETPERLARVLVAGKTAELVLIGKTDEGTSDSDFENFLLFSKGKPHELILLWKRTEESHLAELSADLNQQKEIVHNAARFEQEIFGSDRSVRTISSTPAPPGSVSNTPTF
jgi:hypothetical protein